MAQMFIYDILPCQIVFICKAYVSRHIRETEQIYSQLDGST